MDEVASMGYLESRAMRRVSLKASILLCLVAGAFAASGEPRLRPGSDYFPPPGDAWERREPAELGMHPGRLAAAVRFAIENETSMPVDLEAGMRERLAGKPHNELLGPLKPRGSANGLVLRHGYIVAEWGDTRRVDMTFSVTKSYLATVAGLALDRGRIVDLDASVAESIRGIGFDSPHNARITWRHLLQQTSEWQGTLWGKPDTADRRRGAERELQAPGTFWEYNDVRVNQTALALLRLWGEALPEVLRVEVMDPIGASDTWIWHGYRNSDVEVDGRTVRSVSGGGHWGGGLWISSRDQARFGYLHLRGGRWGERRLLSEDWLDELATASELRPTYGLMWWLNSGRQLWPSAPESSFAARGGGDNLVWIDPEHDLVAVLRWIERGTVDAFLERLLASVQPRIAAFVDVTETHLPGGLDGPSMDAATADVDGDGDQDLLIAQEHRANILLLNDGRGRFTDVSGERLPQVAHDSEDIAFADFDGDGDLDAVVVSEDDEVNELYLNDGGGTFSDGGERLPVGGRSNAVQVADLDLDGSPDLVIGNQGQNVLLLGDGRGYFHDATAGRLPAADDATQDLELGDADGDGDLDLLVANHGDNRLLLNDGSGRFAAAPAGHLPLRAAAEETREADFGDVDGDGDLDIFFANIRGFVRDADPQNRLLLGDGRGVFRDATGSRLPADSDRCFDGDFVDVDGDGDLDILTSVANRDMQRRAVVAGPYRVYLNDGAGVFREATGAVMPPSAVGRGFDVEAADFDGDGRLDLYLASRGGADRLLLAQRRPD